MSSSCIRSKPNHSGSFVSSSNVLLPGKLPWIWDLWDVPDDYTDVNMLNKRELPTNWWDKKKKVFHLILQIYGQMVSDNLKYGIIHIYEVWWFCCRDVEGNLKISHALERGDTGPSVLQTIKTLDGFGDKTLEKVKLHPSSATKATSSKPSGHQSSQSNPSSQPCAPHKRLISQQRQGGCSNRAQDRKRGISDLPDQGDEVDSKEFARGVFMWDCHLVDRTDSVKLLSSKKDPSVLIKMQADPTRKHVAEEMENEAAIYEALSRNSGVREAIPSFTDSAPIWA